MKKEMTASRPDFCNERIILDPENEGLAEIAKHKGMRRYWFLFRYPKANGTVLGLSRPETAALFQEELAAFRMPHMARTATSEEPPCESNGKVIPVMGRTFSTPATLSKS